MSTRRPFLLLALVSALAVGACVEDPIPPDIEIPLTEEEAELLGLQAFRSSLLRALEVTRDTAEAEAAGPSLVPTTFSFQDSLTIACARGGSITTTVTLSGTLDPDTGTGELDVVSVDRHEECVVEGESKVPFYVTGAPSLTLAFSMLFRSSGAIDTEGTMTGGVRGTAGYRSSTCEMSLTFSGTVQPDGSSMFKYKGTVCGTAISEKTITPTIPSK